MSGNEGTVEGDKFDMKGSEVDELGGTEEVGQSGGEDEEEVEFEEKGKEDEDVGVDGYEGIVGNRRENGEDGSENEESGREEERGENAEGNPCVNEKISVALQELNAQKGDDGSGEEEEGDGLGLKSIENENGKNVEIESGKSIEVEKEGAGTRVEKEIKSDLEKEMVSEEEKKLQEEIGQTEEKDLEEEKESKEGEWNDEVGDNHFKVGKIKKFEENIAESDFKVRKIEKTEESKLEEMNALSEKSNVKGDYSVNERKRASDINENEFDENRNEVNVKRQRTSSGVPSVLAGLPKNAPPALKSVPHSRLFIGNLASEHTSAEQLVEIFGKYGTIIELPTIRKSYAFIQYDNADSVLQAIEHENGRTLHSLSWELSIAGTRERKSAQNSSDKYRNGSAFGQYPQRPITPGSRGRASTAKLDVDRIRVLVMGPQAKPYGRKCQNWLMSRFSPIPVDLAVIDREKLGSALRTAQDEHIPLVMVVAGRDEQSRTCSLRTLEPSGYEKVSGQAQISLDDAMRAIAQMLDSSRYGGSTLNFQDGLSSGVRMNQVMMGNQNGMMRNLNAGGIMHGNPADDPGFNPNFAMWRDGPHSGPQNAASAVGYPPPQSQLSGGNLLSQAPHQQPMIPSVAAPPPFPFGATQFGQFGAPPAPLSSSSNVPHLSSLPYQQQQQQQQLGGFMPDSAAAFPFNNSAGLDFSGAAGSASIPIDFSKLSGLLSTFSSQQQQPPSSSIPNMSSQNLYYGNNSGTSQGMYAHSDPSQQQQQQQQQNAFLQQMMMNQQQQQQQQQHPSQHQQQNNLGPYMYPPR